MLNVGIIGTNIEISTSKMIKRIAMRKNRIEKGTRDLLKKLNPHSNGLHFFVQFLVFLERNVISINKVIAIRKVDKM